MGFGNNFQRDGMHQMQVPKGRVAYEPNSLDEGKGPRENPTHGFHSVPEEMSGEKVRKRSDTFADHYSQARMFYRSQTEPEQRHIISAFAFELAKVDAKAIRIRMLSHLAVVDSTLHSGVVAALGMNEANEEFNPSLAPRDLPLSPSLSLLANAKPILNGRKIGVLVTDGFDSAHLANLLAGVENEKAVLVVIAPKIGGAKDNADKWVEADMALSGAPSVLFDSVVVLTSMEGGTELATNASAIDWVRDAFGHCKVLGYSSEAQPLLDAAMIKPDPGVIEISKNAGAFIDAAKDGRIWSRELGIRPPG